MKVVSVPSVRVAGVVVVLAVMIGSFVLSGCRKSEPTADLARLETATPEPATPEPVIVKATPTPAPEPVVMATPVPATPTPPPVDLATVVATPSLWPPQVALLTPISLPVTIGGRLAGEVKAPAGSIMKLTRVLGAQVEIEYQNARHLVATDSTDLMARAIAISQQPAAATPPPAPAQLASIPFAPPAPAPSSAMPETAPLELNSREIGERVTLECFRQKRSRVEGGDWDDRMERIELKVRLTNTDPRKNATKLKGEIYIFAQSIVDRSAMKLLALEGFEIQLPPRATHELITKEVTTQYDTTDARFGFKYDAWFIRVRDSSGKEVLVKSNSPTMVKNAAKIANLQAGRSYDRTTFAEKVVLR